VISVLQIVGDEPEALAIGSDISAAVAVDDTAVPVVDSLSLVGWIVADAHRIAEDTPPNCHVLDLRTDQERAAIPIRGTLVVPPLDTHDAQYEAIVAVLDAELTAVDKNKPLVIVDSDGSSAAGDLIEDLRIQGLNALLLDGGAAAWEDNVLAADATWPEWVLGTATELETPTTIPTVADYHALVTSWMTGNASEIPAYVSIPGTVQLPSEAATVVATGSGGGGCG
jgi:rhodanese-related sulfurtransferase